MRHLQSHRSSLLNFEEAAYYKYGITRPFHLSDPVLRGGRTAPPTCGGLGSRGPYEGCSLYEKKLGRTRGVTEDTVLPNQHCQCMRNGSDRTR